ncbi:hypothetical protein [Kiloniella sp. b19]|uniref:hypothetical protein n=1 Tax=Kiloniella sp. GXU_MW_B19 TaxID=3141326 RepID=UPI0031D1F6EC
MKKLFALFSMTALLSLVQLSSAHAEDKLDETLDDFIEAIVALDNEAFYDVFLESFTTDPRLTPEDIEKADMRAQLDNIMSQREFYGNILSQGIIRKKQCKDKIASVIWLAFADQGQFFFSFNFFNVDGDWSIATIDIEGRGGFEDLLNALEENSRDFC